jgi:TRAP-type mannitol/chloroaromatic compound transport system permease large subunit
VVLLIALVLGSIYTGLATATEAAAFGVVAALAISGAQGSLNWQPFRVSLSATCRSTCAQGDVASPLVRIY